MPAAALAEAALTEPALPTPSRAHRYAVLAAASLALFGGYYLYDSLGLVADLLKEGLRISDAQYGFLSGIYSLAAVLVLLLGGAVIDRIGPKRAVLLFAAITAAAGVLIAAAPSYRVLLGGRFLLGIGSEPLCVAVSTALARWFKGRELSFAFGLNLTIARLGSVAADRSPLWAPGAYDGGGFTRPLWLAALIGLSCVLGGALYYALERSAERRYDHGLGPSGTTDKLTFADLVAGFGARYWFVVGLCVTFYAAIFPFQSFATKFFIEAHGTSRDQAGALLSYLPASAMLATPLFGLLVDRISRRTGRRALLMMVGSLLIAPVYLMMAAPGIPLFLPVSLMGIAFSLIPAVMWPAVAYLVDPRRLGTAYALMTLLQQIGVFGVSAALGHVNDASRASAANPGGYALGMLMLTGLSFLGLLFAGLLFSAEKRAAADQRDS